MSTIGRAATVVLSCCRCSFHAILLVLALAGITAPVIHAGQSRKVASPYFRITVVDRETGRGVPLAKLTTTNQAQYWTDSAGVVAFCEPDLIDKDVWFSVESYGYSLADGDASHPGVRLHPTAAGSAVIRMQRENIAQRLYRITGAGIYRDSVLLGDNVPPTQDPSPSPVMGQDSVATAVYGGKVFWIWGDTNVAGSRLGNFRVTGATSELPDRGGLDPEVGVDLKYFRLPNGSLKPMANIGRPGVVWFGRLRVGLDHSGKEHLFAPYLRTGPGSSANAQENRGWAVFDDASQDFKFVCTAEEFDRLSEGQPHWYEAARAGGLRWHWGEHGWHEFGDLRWRWKEPLDRTVEKQIRRLVESGDIVPGKPWKGLADVESGNRVVEAESANGDTVCWNEHRRRWVSVRLEAGGKSTLGEVWYVEGDTPQGPWVYAQKVATHLLANNSTYTFYNVYQHPEFDKQGGRVVFFEGTYCTFLARAPFPTPYYDYNQIMYKLDLDDPRLFLPVPVYCVGDPVPRYVTKAALPDTNQDRRIVWYAADRQRKGTIPIYQHLDKEKETTVLTPDKSVADHPTIAFYAVAAAEDASAETTVQLNEFIHAGTGKRLYATADSVQEPGYERVRLSICRVWRAPR